MKIIKNLKNMNADKKDGFFSYWSCICYTAFVTYLRKHYKMVNGKRKVLLLALEHSEQKYQNHKELIKGLREQIEFYNNERTSDGTKQKD